MTREARQTRVSELSPKLELKARPVPRSSLVMIQPGGSKPPFFCVPGSEGDVFTDIGHLARRLGPDQPFYGFWNGIHDPTQIEARAAGYVDEIRAVQPRGPYLLGGVCSGGVVAFEVARQLQAQGQQVALLALVEPTHAPSLGLRPYVSLTAGVLRRVIHCLGHYARSDTRRASAEQETYLYLKAKHVVDSWPLRYLVPQPYPGRIHLFLVNGVPEGSPDGRCSGWHEWAAGGAEIHVIPGTHDTIAESKSTPTEGASLQALAGQLGACIDEALADGYRF
jgi:thioesterase domain-containing protein